MEGHFKLRSQSLSAVFRFSLNCVVLTVFMVSLSSLSVYSNPSDSFFLNVLFFIFISSNLNHSPPPHFFKCFIFRIKLALGLLCLAPISLACLGEQIILINWRNFKIFFAQIQKNLQLMYPMPYI